MMPWVLIIVFHVGFGTAAITIDQKDKAVCEANLEALKNNAKDLSSALCLPKGKWQ